MLFAKKVGDREERAKGKRARAREKKNRDASVCVELSRDYLDATSLYFYERREIEMTVLFKISPRRYDEQ